MSGFGVLLYLAVLAASVAGWRYCSRRSKKAAIITLAGSPIYLFLAHRISPYLNWRGKFDNWWRLGRQLGFSADGAVAFRYVVVFVLFWIIAFALAALTFWLASKQTKDTEQTIAPQAGD